MSKIEFHVTGTPATKGSAKAIPFRRKSGRLGVSVMNDNRKAKAWAALVAIASRGAMAGRPLLHGPVRVETDFFLPRPKSHFRKDGTFKPDAPAVPTVKRLDGDKMTRCVWDALSGFVYFDDCQVTQWAGSKNYATGKPGARIVVEAVAV